MKFHRTLFAILAMAATSAHAGDWYALGMVTHSSADLNHSAIDNTLTTAGVTGLSTSTKDKSNKWRLQLGYQFNDYLAVEGGYIDLGDSKYRATYSSGGAAGKIKSAGPNLSLLGMLPVGRDLSLFGELGVIDATTKSELTATGVGAAASDSYSKTKVRPVYGIGAMYKVNDNIGMRLSYERVNGLGEKSRLGNMDVNMYSVGLSYLF